MARPETGPEDCYTFKGQSIHRIILASDAISCSPGNKEWAFGAEFNDLSEKFAFYKSCGAGG